MVIPLLVGRRETPLPPAGVHLVLSVYRYDEYRFFVSGYDVQKGRICETAVLEGDLSAEDQRHVQMSAHLGEETVIDFFVSRMKLHEAGLSGGDNVSTLESALEDSSTLGLFLIFTRPNSAGAGNEQE
uniref:Uncharacterized protein n=1 Tax=Chromera velia CCMP2878 TaxID=1169474 RepID=A0A0G4I1H8_9ALVE|eukprot:Cvel_34675.t1-p1 / transcript=Cvel_34675.t1 / gene=Cvel_34675 / organism=Chromera_velia_CCMP2878 / gene_product=hypothetical protein / transcript_product=hypothetical protein / location=Cvel_scaffold6034:2660-3753(-) / protein_length=127 / sequence_SO=supercontig / SO=protein_coding / is_pseudo=false